METTETQPKKRGRPQRYSRGRITLTTRFTMENYAIVKDRALASGRSISEEIENRIEKSITEERLSDLRREFEEWNKKIWTGSYETIQEFAAEIGELRKQIAALERDRTLSLSIDAEETLAQIVENAVTRAFAARGKR